MIPSGRFTCAAAVVIALTSSLSCATGNRYAQILALEQEAASERTAAAKLAGDLSTTELLAPQSAAAAGELPYYEARGRVLNVDRRLDPASAARYTCQVLRDAGLNRCEYRDATEQIRVSRGDDCAPSLGELSVPVLMAIAFAAAPERRGAEVDVRLANPGTGEVRFVSVRHESTREIFVEARTAIALPAVGDRPQPDGADAASRFGIGPPEDGSGRWSLHEFASVIRALELLSERERLAIRGVPMRRDREAPAGRPMEEAGEFQLEVASAVIERRIVIFDRAFATDEVAFVGSVDAPERPSVNVVLHEIGHALSLYAHFVRLQDLSGRIGRFNELVERFNHLGRHVREREMSSFENIKAAIDGTHANLERATPAAERLAGTTEVLRSFSDIPGARAGPTAYARTSLLEAFAESFALYHADPEALRRFSPEVHAYFATGQHVLTLPEVPAPAGPAASSM